MQTAPRNNDRTGSDSPDGCLASLTSHTDAIKHTDRLFQDNSFNLLNPRFPLNVPLSSLIFEETNFRNCLAALCKKTSACFNTSVKLCDVRAEYNIKI